MDQDNRDVTQVRVENVPSERASENIEAWEKKHAVEETPAPGGDLSDDAESGGP